ncbi:UDP-N-acetylglucosamine 2-epimerase [Dongshaea marina]|uniref:UDP-N-acetylglucosamine 2-epimerase n=1 Tax=Dongshaea marina TaxID=2047966 RepID=UPI000D3E8B64|nr:UDP-N-acetylglucosamine 2-epimerase [Dongshaea marina]
MMQKIFKVTVVTGGRADYGLLRPLLKALKKHPKFELQLAVTGAHCCQSWGDSLSTIHSDGFHIAAEVDMQLASDTPVGMSKSLGLGVLGMSAALSRLKPDALVLLGDRYEIFAAAQAALFLKVPVVHLHGGELSQGAVDDSIRHCISKIASLHFCSTEEYRQRLLQLGEAVEAVYDTGPLALDNIRELKLLTRDELVAELGSAFSRPYLLMTLHPETATNHDPRVLSELLCETLRNEWPHQIIMTSSNSDAGGQQIEGVLESYVQKYPEQFVLYKHLGVLRYMSAVSCAKAVVGNSSSGLLEVPLLGTPTLDIGERQRGRTAPISVIRACATAREIVNGLERALSKSHQELSKHHCHTYGEDSVAERMINVLLSHLQQGLGKLPFVDRMERRV